VQVSVFLGDRALLALPADRVLEPMACRQSPVADPVTRGTFGEAAVQAGDPHTFTGEVELRNLPSPFSGQAPGVAWVRFLHGARTNWHVHLGGQILYVLDGDGCVVSDGGAVTRIAPNDLVRIPAGVRHWHGALSDTTMTHLSVTCGETVWPDPAEPPDALP